MAGTAPGTEGRIANVSAIVWVEATGDALAAELEADLGSLFAEVLVVREERHPDGQPESPVSRLSRALACATADRVLIVGTGAPLLEANAWLALTAWPEHDAVALAPAGEPLPLCAIYRTAAVRDAAGRARSSGVTSLEALLEAVDTARIEGPDLAAISPPEGLR
jgi:molybdopterin-guanine dinucleotide biosynthesis protein A